MQVWVQVEQPRPQVQVPEEEMVQRSAGASAWNRRYSARWWGPEEVPAPALDAPGGLEGGIEIVEAEADESLARGQMRRHSR